jgi:AAA family ATPase
MIIDNVECKGEKRTFRISSIEGFGDKDALHRFTEKSKVKISQGQVGTIATSNPTNPTKSLQISNTKIGGLDSLIKSLNQELISFEHDRNKQICQLGGEGGLLFYGAPGTGKSMLLEKIAATGWGKVYPLGGSVVGRYLGDTESAIRKVFADAKKNQPSIIIIDELDSFAPKRSRSENGEVKIVPTLISELDSLSEAVEGTRPAKVLVIAATNKPNDVDEALRRPGRFETEFELPIPDAKARSEILKALLGMPMDQADEILDDLGYRTHGFVGADLKALLKKAFKHAMFRTADGHQRSDEATTQLAKPQSEDGPNDAAKLDITQEDIEAALLKVRPTAMREVILEPPKVLWSDIGGQEEVKQSLREAVEWPLKVCIIPRICQSN